MTARTSKFWEDLSRSWLHDPIDKALNIPDHENRATEMQYAFLGEAVDDARGGEGSKDGDVISSILERLPLPDFKKSKQETSISRDNLERVCPVTGKKNETFSTSGLAVLRKDEDSSATDHLENIKKAFPDMRKRYLALWRFFPELMSEYRELPADTRLRDHSIVDHCDMCASTTAAYWRAEGKGSHYHAAGLLTFSLGPVQSQIAAARSVRDLWSGSYILSWLTFQAMIPIIEAYGPQSLIFPSLRASPLMDAWLQGQFGSSLPQGCTLDTSWDSLRAAAYPNTFQAMISMDQADDIRQACQDALMKAWESMGDAVKNTLDENWKKIYPDWSQGWDQQIRNTWDCRAQVTEFLPPQSDKRREATESLQKNYTVLLGDKPEHIQCVQAISEHIAGRGHLPYLHPNADVDKATERAQQQAGLWMLGSEMAGRRLWADKQARRIPTDENDTRQKCSLYGTWAAMGPASKQFRKFWKTASTISGKNIVGMIKEGEHLCAAALVKRFAWGTHIAPQLQQWDCSVALKENSIPDTHSLCTAWWRKQAHAITKNNNPKAWTDFEDALDFFRKQEDNEDIAHPSFIEDLYACLLPTNNNQASWLSSEMPPAVRQNMKGQVNNLLNKRSALIKSVREHDSTLGYPRSYYAILVADGDDMGKWLRGDKAMPLKDAYHPQILNKYFRSGKMSPQLQKWLGNSDDDNNNIDKSKHLARRPLTPASQAAFSATLTKFSHTISKNVFPLNNTFGATLVYAGGDDVLAILPIEQALQAASALNKAWQQALPGATLSAGLVMVHHLSDLRTAMDAARAAEKQAKESGKNKLCWSVLRRGGDATSTMLSWDLAEQCQDQVPIMRQGSDGWIAQLIQEKDVLQGLADNPDTRKMIGQRIKYLLSHSDNTDSYGSDVFEWWSSLVDKHFDADLDTFIACCKNMQFLARNVDAG